MDDAIVAQIDWYMGRLNLPSDDFLKDRMDQDLWVDLAVILEFPKMIRMGVRSQDKDKVASLLHTRSSIVEVDVANARIRPAWARRSTLVLNDVPSSARLDDIYALLQVPAAAAPSPNSDQSLPNSDPNSNSNATHASGLLSVQPASETVWLALFDSPIGAQAALPLVMEKTIDDVKIRPEVHVENSLRPQAHQQQDPVAFVRSANQHVPPGSVFIPSGVVQSNPQEGHGATAVQQQTATGNASVPPVSAAIGYGPMMGPIGIPVPVMHHAPEGIHPQYGYATPTGYMPHGYVPHNVAVPRPFMRPRAIPGVPANYMMAYPQAGHGFDPAAMGVAAQHGPQSVQPSVEGSALAGSASNSSVCAPAPEARHGAEGQQQGPAMPGSGSGSSSNATVAERPGKSIDLVTEGREVTAGVDFVQDKVSAQYSALSVAEQIQMPMVGSQALDASQMMSMQMREVVGKGSIDPHYLHRGAVIGDPNALGLGPSMTGAGYAPYPRGAGRGQHQHQGGLHRGDRNGQRNAGEGGRGGPRGSGGSAMDASGRGQQSRKGKKGNRNNNGRHAHAHGDGRNDGKTDGSGSPSNRDDRRTRDDKPKPEPNLNSMHFPPLPMANDTPSARGGQPSITSDFMDLRVANSDGKMEHVDVNDAQADEIPSRLAAPDGKAISLDVGSQGTAVSSATEGKAFVEESASVEIEKKDLDCVNNVVVATASSACEEVEKNASKSLIDKKVVEQGTNLSNSNGSTMSYAAILRSKKPALARPSNLLQRGLSESSTKSVDTSGSSGDGSGGTSGNSGKDYIPRRRKSSNVRAPPSNSDPSNSGTGITEGINDDKMVPKIANNPFGEASSRDQESTKSKAAPEASRPHSVWANKPKSLFQAAASSPAGRPSSHLITGEVRKTISPVPSQEDNAGLGKLEGQSRLLDVNGQAESASIETQGTAVTDASANGDDLPDINQLSMAPPARDADQVDGDAVKVGKGDQTSSNGGQATPKGAWALGGPKAWPKSTGNGFLERSNGISDS